MPEEEVKDSTIEELLPPKKKPEETKPVLKNSSDKKLNLKSNPNKKPTQRTNNVPTPEPEQKPIKKLKPKYEFIGRIPLSQLIREKFSKEFIPTDRFASILGVIFLLVVILALIQFPFGRLLSGDVNIVSKIGWPWPFLELKIMNPEENPLRALNLFYDMIIYLLISYAIDVIINFILNSKIVKSKEELQNRPKVYKNMNSSLADKITKRFFTKKEDVIVED
jgi:hypothetical protein